MSHSPRFSELRRLVFDYGLTQEETRYLKILLCGKCMDLVGELPLEIIISIALLLEPRDFSRCLRVSRAWRQQFLSDSVMRIYARRRWPAMINGAVNQSTFLEAIMIFAYRSTYELRSVHHQSCSFVEKVPWHNQTHYTLDPVFHTQPDNLPDVYNQCSPSLFQDERLECDKSALYAYGKVAWHLPPCVIVIDDLRSKTRKVLTPPSGTMHGSALKLRSLGSRLAIGTIGRQLVAWDHVDDRAYEKPLPSRILRCVTQNNNVAIMLQGGDLITWTPGYAAIQLDTSGLILERSLILGSGDDSRRVKTWKTCLNVFFDARNSKNLYLASGYSKSVNTIRVTVHEFSESVHVASWSSDFHDPRFEYDDPRFGSDRPGPEPPIMSFDYEFDHSYIIFNRGTMGSCNPPFAVFDKIERKLVHIDDCLRSLFFDDKHAKFDHRWRKRDTRGFLEGYLDFGNDSDLDFYIDFHNGEYYTVYRRKHYRDGANGLGSAPAEISGTQ